MWGSNTQSGERQQGGGWGGRDWKKWTQEGAGEKHKGFHIAIGFGGEGASPFQTFEKKEKTKTPKHHVKLREQ